MPSFTQMQVPLETNKIWACVKANLGTNAKFTALFHKITFIQPPGNSSCIGEIPKLHTAGIVAVILKSLVQGICLGERCGSAFWLFSAAGMAPWPFKLY